MSEILTDSRNNEGQLNVSNWRDIVAVSAGHSQTVGLRADGTVVMAGSSWPSGYLGSRGFAESNFGDMRDIIAISAGYHNVVGLDIYGGIQSARPLGNNIIAPNIQGIHPLTGSGSSGYVSVSMGGVGTLLSPDGIGVGSPPLPTNRVLALRADGTVVGFNNYRNDAGRREVGWWTGPLFGVGSWRLFVQDEDGNFVLPKSMPRPQINAVILPDAPIETPTPLLSELSHLGTPMTLEQARAWPQHGGLFIKVDNDNFIPINHQWVYVHRAWSDYDIRGGSGWVRSEWDNVTCSNQGMFTAQDRFRRVNINANNVQIPRMPNNAQLVFIRPPSSTINPLINFAIIRPLDRGWTNDLMFFDIPFNSGHSRTAESPRFVRVETERGYFEIQFNTPLVGFFGIGRDARWIDRIVEFVPAN